ncbi:MAG: hypothetical protein QW580_07410 [Nitrososphaerota archaeon]
MPVASRIPLRVVFGAALIALALALPSAYAQAYNITVEDARIKVRLSYPPEVEIGSCFNVQIEVTALSALTNLSLSLKITYFYDGNSQILYNSVLIPLTNVSGPSVILFKNINLCIPTPVAVDPWIEAKVYVKYFTDTTPVEISNTFYMSTVRRVSYERLAASLAEANREVSRLRSEVADLRARLDEALTRKSELEARVAELTQIKEELEKRLAELQDAKADLEKQLSDLMARYSQLLTDDAALQERYKSLMDNYALLQKSYEELRRDYETVSRDLASTRSLYSELQMRHDSLRSSYEASVKTVGQLEGSLKELERQRGVLEAMLAQVTGESGFFKNVAVGQGVGLVALGGVATWVLMRRRGRAAGIVQAPAAPAPQPPSSPSPPASPQGSTTTPSQSPTTQTTAPEPRHPVEEAPESEVVQKVISGRRVTIPSRLAERLGIGIGDSIKIGLLGDRLILVPIRANGAAYPQPAGPASQPQHSSETRVSQNHQGRERLPA